MDSVDLTLDDGWLDPLQARFPRAAPQGRPAGPGGPGWSSAGAGPGVSSLSSSKMVIFCRISQVEVKVEVKVEVIWPWSCGVDRCRPSYGCSLLSLWCYHLMLLLMFDYCWLSSIEQCPLTWLLHA